LQATPEWREHARWPAARAQQRAGFRQQIPVMNDCFQAGTRQLAGEGGIARGQGRFVSAVPVSPSSRVRL